MHKIKEVCRYALQFLTYRILYLFNRFKPNQVLFVSLGRTQLEGNQKAMDEAINDPSYHKVYYLKQDGVKMNSFSQSVKLMKLLLHSQYVFLQYETPLISLMKPQPGQKIIQLWHGPAVFKRVGKSRGDKKNSKFRSLFTHRNYTMAICCSEDNRPFSAEGFNTSMDKVQALGFPRTDMFFNSELISQLQQKVYNQYPHWQGKKIVLFAPTFRGVRINNANYDYQKLDLDLIYERLKDQNIIFLFKWHPAILNYDKNLPAFTAKLSKYHGFYEDVSNYHEINELLTVSSVLITDYSSVLFEFALLDRLVIMYPYDLQEYVQGRGLYYPYDNYVIGPVAKDSEQLALAIMNGKIDEEKRKEFLKLFMNSCDGKATQKVYQAVFGKDPQ